MTNKLKLTKISMETKAGKQVELTIEEAKELHDQLHQLFGNKVVYVPSTPIVIERNWWRPYGPTWSTNSIGDSLMSVSGDSGLSVSYQGVAV